MAHWRCALAQIWPGGDLEECQACSFPITGGLLGAVAWHCDWYPEATAARSEPAFGGRAPLEAEHHRRQSTIGGHGIPWGGPSQDWAQTGPSSWLGSGDAVGQFSSSILPSFASCGPAQPQHPVSDCQGRACLSPDLSSRFEVSSKGKTVIIVIRAFRKNTGTPQSK